MNCVLRQIVRKPEPNTEVSHSLLHIPPRSHSLLRTEESKQVKPVSRTAMAPRPQQSSRRSDYEESKMNEEQKPGIEKDNEISSQGEPHLSRPRNTYTDASWMSKMFFAWPQKLLEEGMLNTIEDWDLPSLMDEETSARNREIFESIWKDEIDRVEAIKAKLPLHSKNRQTLRPSLRRAVIKEFFRSTWIVQPLMCAASAARIVMAVALGNLIQSFIDKSKEGYFWAGVLVFCNTVVLFEHHHVFFITWRKGMQYRIAAIASIFAKSLR